MLSTLRYVKYQLPQYQQRSQNDSWYIFFIEMCGFQTYWHIVLHQFYSIHHNKFYHNKYVVLVTSIVDSIYQFAIQKLNERWTDVNRFVNINFLDSLFLHINCNYIQGFWSYFFLTGLQIDKFYYYKLLKRASMIFLCVLGLASFSTHFRSYQDGACL